MNTWVVARTPEEALEKLLKSPIYKKDIFTDHHEAILRFQEKEFLSGQSHNIYSLLFELG